MMEISECGELVSLISYQYDKINDLEDKIRIYEGRIKYLESDSEPTTYPSIDIPHIISEKEIWMEINGIILDYIDFIKDKVDDCSICPYNNNEAETFNESCLHPYNNNDKCPLYWNNK